MIFLCAIQKHETALGGRFQQVVSELCQDNPWHLRESETFVAW
jgi:hypothetical protein